MAKQHKATTSLVSQEEIQRSEMRDWFAGCAMLGGMPAFFSPDSEWSDYDDVAESCYRMAEAMMRRRDREREKAEGRG